jgi:type IV secretory pathway VirB10-like protein
MKNDQAIGLEGLRKLMGLPEDITRITVMGHKQRYPKGSGHSTRETPDGERESPLEPRDSSGEPQIPDPQAATATLDPNSTSDVADDQAELEQEQRRQSREFKMDRRYRRDRKAKLAAASQSLPKTQQESLELFRKLSNIF